MLNLFKSVMLPLRRSRSSKHFSNLLGPLVMTAKTCPIFHYVHRGKKKGKALIRSGVIRVNTVSHLPSGAKKKHDQSNSHILALKNAKCNYRGQFCNFTR